MIKNKGTKILILSLTFSGLLSTGTGIVLNNMNLNMSSSKIEVKVVEKQVARLKSNVPVLKELEVEINEPISVDVKDYISNIDDISSNVLRAFKLDTSLVNVTQPGKYSYVIQYNNKKYKGTITVKDKEEKKVELLHIKNFSVKVNDVLPTDVASYITDYNETIDKTSIALDTTKVDVQKPGDYQYTLTYNKMMYTGTITVYEEQPTQVLNTIEYKIVYVCGSESVEYKIKNDAAPSKYISIDINKALNIDDNKNADGFLKDKKCNIGIDHIESKRTNSNVSFPLRVQNGDVFTIYFKSSAQAQAQPQPQTPVVESNTNTQN